MKLLTVHPSCPRRRPPARRRAQARASAILVVLVLLAIMAALLYANTQTLRVLQQELKLVDEKQKQKYGQGARD